MGHSIHVVFTLQHQTYWSNRSLTLCILTTTDVGQLLAHDRHAARSDARLHFFKKFTRFVAHVLDQTEMT